MAVKERMTRDNFHLRIMASAVDVLDRNQNILKPAEVDFLNELKGYQTMRVMPTLKQWNWMKSLKQTVQGL